MKVKCQVEGCPWYSYDDILITENTTYVCRFHTPKTEVIHFQDHQFDKELRKGHHPEGTNHLKNQGSEIETSEDPYNSVYRGEE